MGMAKKSTASTNSAQPVISSFFSPSPIKGKRKGSLSDEASTSKPQKLRKSDSAEVPSGNPVPLSPVAADRWRFAPDSPEKPHDGPVIDAAATKKKVRQEAFKRKLLGENSPFISNSSSSENPAALQGNADNGWEENETSSFRKTIDTFTHTGGAKQRGGVEVGPSGQTYTPLEKQIRQLKERYKGALLMVEVGYKYRFFGHDAEIAARELGIVCFMDRNFLTASIPTHRRDVHLKKLLSQGYKVGIVEQTETAALKKASESKNAPFERKLTYMYTATTFVEDMASTDELPHTPPLMCLSEQRKGDKMIIGMVAITPSSGDIVWDEFEDTIMRIELETRLAHIQPSELLLPETRLSAPTEKMLQHFGNASARGSTFRIERTPAAMVYTEAFDYLTDFYTRRNSESTTAMAVVTGFSNQVVIALAHAIKHLVSFNIADAFLATQFFNRFTSQSYMLLNSNTLSNLEIFRNETDGTTKGSLIWILDHTKTKFGSRLLRGWVGKPLTDMTLLQERFDAVDEIVNSNSENILSLRHLLKGLPDLAKGLSRIQYGQCTPVELATLLLAFNKVATAFQAYDNRSDIGMKSHLLTDIIVALPLLRKPVQSIIADISLRAAAEGHKADLWTNEEKYPALEELKTLINVVEIELNHELKSIRKILKVPSLEWANVNGEEYVVEVKRSENRPIPETWFLLSSTKTARRYHTPEVKKKLQELSQHRELLEDEGNKSFLAFLGEISDKHYGLLRDAINKLATADCLFSLAEVALQQDYHRPIFQEDDILEIVDGRHPMIEALRSDPFVPNSCTLGGIDARHKVITGPNMGGKSSAVRMVALICIMAQIGAYVPAATVRLGLLDSVHTRMGASDMLSRGKSTFMVEMSETSEILRSATSKSLVVLDELGRGTSTIDGMAVASAVLQHLVQDVKCKTLFITHYPLIATQLALRFPLYVQNLHMAYTEESRIDGRRDIIFMYRLTTGLAKESYGVECARLAGLPESLLSNATSKANTMRTHVTAMSRQARLRTWVRLLRQCFDTSIEKSSTNLTIIIQDMEDLVQMNI